MSIRPPPQYFFCFRKSPRRLGLRLYLSVVWGACQDGEGGRSRVLSYKQWDSSGKCWLPNKGKVSPTVKTNWQPRERWGLGPSFREAKETLWCPQTSPVYLRQDSSLKVENTSLSNVCPQNGTQDSEGRAQKAKGLLNSHGKKP